MKKSLLLIAALFATHAGAAYRCVDEKGKTHVGDTPPAGCANVVMQEVSKGGQILRSIDPTMTAEQLKVKEEAAAKKAEADKAASEQKRKDTALLSTYSSEKEFDVVRERNIEPLKGRIKTAQDRLKAVDKRLKDLDEEMEFYSAGKGSGGKGKKDKEAPKNLTEEQERLKNEKVGIAKSIAASEKEIEETRAKSDVDKKRWVGLKAGTKAAEDPGKAK